MSSNQIAHDEVIVLAPGQGEWLTSVLDFVGDRAQLEHLPDEIRARSGVCIWREGGAMEPVAGPCAVRQIKGFDGPSLEVLVGEPGRRVVTRRLAAVDVRLLAPLDLRLARSAASGHAPWAGRRLQ